MIFVENVERENCFGLRHFKPNIECPFQNWLNNNGLRYEVKLSGLCVSSSCGR
jgi:hypothetical protein